MNLIEELRKRLSRIKIKLVEDKAEVKENIETINHILDIKEASEELKRKLILLHSLNKAEKQALEAFYAKLLIELITINDLMLVEIENMKKKLSDKKDKSLKRLLPIYIVGSVSFIILWMLFHFDKEATTKVLENVLKIINYII